MTTALKANDMDTANREKRAVEDHQRHLVKMREEQNITWSPHYFDLINDKYLLKGFSWSVSTRCQLHFYADNN